MKTSNQNTLYFLSLTIILMACSKNKSIFNASRERNRIELYFNESTISNLTDTIYIKDTNQINLTCNLVVEQGVFEFEKLMYQIEDSLKIISSDSGSIVNVRYSVGIGPWKKNNIDFIDPYSDKLFIPVKLSLMNGIGYYDLRFKAYSYKNLDSSNVISKKIYLR